MTENQITEAVEGTLTTAGAELLREARDRMTPENFAWENWGQGDDKPCCISGHINKVLDARGESPPTSCEASPYHAQRALGFHTYTPALSQLFTGWKRGVNGTDPAPGALSDVVHATDTINLFLLAHGHPIDVIDVPVPEPEEAFCFV